MSGWVQISFGKNKLENHPKIVLHKYCSYLGVVHHVYFLYTLLKVVSNYDWSALSMSVMGFQTKKFG